MIIEMLCYKFHVTSALQFVIFLSKTLKLFFYGLFDYTKYQSNIHAQFLTFCSTILRNMSFNSPFLAVTLTLNGSFPVCH